VATTAVITGDSGYHGYRGEYGSVIIFTARSLNSGVQTLRLPAIGVLLVTRAYTAFPTVHHSWGTLRERFLRVEGAGKEVVVITRPSHRSRPLARGRIACVLGNAVRVFWAVPSGIGKVWAYPGILPGYSPC